MNKNEINNRLRREKKLEEYYKNPNHCNHCGKVIEMLPHQKTNEVRVKKFCNQSCSTTFNNLSRGKKEKPPKVIKTPKIKNTRPKKFEYLNSLTKKELYNLRGVYYKFRATIRRQAHHNFMVSDKPKECLACGYDKHVEVCHIKSVSEFDDNTIVSEINHIDNLIGLCPTHHWEFDNGYLKIKN
jgi:hypothetical protein